MFVVSQTIVRLSSYIVSRYIYIYIKEKVVYRRENNNSKNDNNEYFVMSIFFFFFFPYTNHWIDPSPGQIQGEG